MGIPTILTGARAIININNSVVVYATSVSWDVTTNYEPLYTVDESLPQELVPTKIEVTVTCGTLRVPKMSASLLKLQPTIYNHLAQAYVSIEVRDRATDATILYVPKAMLVKRTGGVAARQLSAETWVFKGIGYWDEKTPTTAS